MSTPAIAHCCLNERSVMRYHFRISLSRKFWKGRASAVSSAFPEKILQLAVEYFP
jgi:hypothetical protein